MFFKSGTKFSSSFTDITHTSVGCQELSSRWEVHADFNRLSMMMMRVVEVDGYVTARKVATATMSQAKIWATIGECNL